VGPAAGGLVIGGRTITLPGEEGVLLVAFDVDGGPRSCRPTRKKPVRGRRATPTSPRQTGAGGQAARIPLGIRPVTETFEGGIGL